MLLSLKKSMNFTYRSSRNVLSISISCGRIEKREPVPVPYPKGPNSLF